MGKLRRAGSLAVITAAVAAFAMLGAAVATIRSLVVPGPRPLDTRVLGFDSDARTITLERTRDTAIPGRWGLFTSGTRDYLQLGDVVDVTDTTATRVLDTPLAAGDVIQPEAGLVSWYFNEPDQLGLPYRDVIIDTPVGECPAWLFPAARQTTWAIHVHGRGVRRQECLRAVEVFNAAGITSLLVSYRNDTDGARTKNGAYGLGSTEWQDVDAAIAYALDNGAERIVLQGYSTGGAIIFQTLLRGAHRDSIVGIVLDSPVIDWTSVLAVHAHESNVPGPITKLAKLLLRHPMTAKLAGADDAIVFEDLNMAARAEELDVATLILVSSGDDYVPDAPAFRLSRARPDIVTRVQFDKPGHVALWNYDPELWNTSVAAWLQAHVTR